MNNLLVNQDNATIFKENVNNKLDISSFSSFLSVNSLALDNKLDSSSFSQFVSSIGDIQSNAQVNKI